jgi:hypothetical protein
MSERKGRITSEHKGIGTLLSQNRFKVPSNQREYSWEEEHITDLLQDFSDAIDIRNTGHFLGTIVLTETDEIPEVADGQQRLATTTVLLAAIRDFFAYNQDEKRAVSLDSDFLFKIDLDTTETVPKLTLNVDDNEFFTDYVLRRHNEPKRQACHDKEGSLTKESHRNIVRASKLCADHVKGVLCQHDKKNHASVLLKWLRFIEKDAEVIVLRVPDHMNAFMMFETLNDRGLKTSQADLLKNHLFSQARTRIREAQQRWATMRGALESLAVEDVTIAYLHHALITMHGPTRSREIFDKIKATVNSQGKAIAFLEMLAEGANDYAALFNPDHAKWNVYGKKTRRHVHTINQHLRVKQILPLMFAVVKHFSLKEVQVAFHLFVSWSVRFLIVGGRGGLLDRNYALRAQEVGCKKIKTARELAKAMEDAVPTNGTFEAAFSDARVSQAFTARYYLRALEMQAKEEESPELIPNDEEEAINVEHVLPEHPGSMWPTVAPELVPAYFRRIGNMVLLKASKNSIIGNKAFKDKKPILSQSTYVLTNSVAEYEEWGVPEIVDRQKKLAALAVRTWPIETP